MLCLLAFEFGTEDVWGRRGSTVATLPLALSSSYRTPRQEYYPTFSLICSCIPVACSTSNIDLTGDLEHSRLFLSTMATGALLDQDFGSESEDDNFNPAPAEESDNDVAADSDPDARPSTKSGTDRWKSRRSEPDDVKDEDDEENKDSASVLVESKPFRGPGLDDEDEGEDVNGVGGDDEEEDEEDLEDEDEEEDVVSVGLNIVHIRLPVR